MPLEAIDARLLFDKVLAQLERGEYTLIGQQADPVGEIAGYRTPLTHSEIILHLNLEAHHATISTNDVNATTLEYIKENKLKITDAVRHADGKFIRIVAKLE